MSYFENEIGFFQEVLLNNHLLRADYLGFDWSGWRVLIKSEIIITTDGKRPKCMQVDNNDSSFAHLP